MKETMITAIPHKYDTHFNLIGFTKKVKPNNPIDIANEARA